MCVSTSARKSSSRAASMWNGVERSTAASRTYVGERHVHARNRIRGAPAPYPSREMDPCSHCTSTHVPRKASRVPLRRVVGAADGHLVAAAHGDRGLSVQVAGRTTSRRRPFPRTIAAASSQAAVPRQVA
jgi:hypothetical protein